MANPKSPLSFQLLGASVRLGAGTVKEAGALFQSAGAKKVLIVTDAGVSGAGLLKPARRSLEETRIPYEIFDRVEPNPSDKSVMEGVQVFKKAGCDAILGVGGGSPLDASKAIQVMASHPGEIHEYFGPAAAVKIIHPRPYLVAVPTTSGTGSEVSRGAIITDTRKKVKCVIRSGPASLAIIDPEMTLTLPPQLTAATGMDALCHHVEACVSNVYHPVCTALALEGVRLVGRSLRRAVTNGDDLDARGDMAVASMTGALAFQKGLGAVHSLAHQLSTEADVPARGRQLHPAPPCDALQHVACTGGIDPDRPGLGREDRFSLHRSGCRAGLCQRGSPRIGDRPSGTAEGCGSERRANPAYGSKRHVRLVPPFQPPPLFPHGYGHAIPGGFLRP